MINKVDLGSKPCFDNDAALLDMKAVNYVFGPNGSGKTTISEYLANCSLNDPKIVWSNGVAQTIKVYNRSSIRSAFTNADGEEAGVFLLGKDSQENENEILKFESEEKKIENKLKSFKDTLRKKREELEEKKEKLSNDIWEKRKGIPEILRNRMLGMKSSKRVVMKEVFKHFDGCSDSSALDFAVLSERAKTVFDNDAETQTTIPTPPILNCDENGLKEILIAPIASRTSSPLSKLIEQLGSSDWVRQGLGYLNNSDESECLCPFCQQKVSKELIKTLLDLYDDEYKKKIQKVDLAYKKLFEVKQEFEEYKSKYIDRLESYSGANDPAAVFRTFEYALVNLLESIKRKTREPSVEIKSIPLSNHYKEIVNYVGQINQKICEYNDIVNNRDKEKERIIAESWCVFTCQTLKDLLELFKNDSDPLEKACLKLETSVLKQENNLKSVKRQLSDARRKAISSARAIEDINSLLQLVQFYSFRLAPSKTRKDGYRIIRNDETLADVSTLSEGERTFITFLYFYHSLSAVVQNGETEKLVAVIDDPISSLDGDTMFVVSALVRKLVDQVQDGQHRVNQLLMLTHNTRFHNEVCYRHRGKVSSKVKFYRIRKYAPQPNRVEDCGESNPIRTAYQELGDEVALAKSHPENSMPWLPNVLRRILESYFSTLGGERDLYEIGSGLSQEEMVLHNALIAWAHSGSHTLIDSDDYVQHSTSNERWLDAFRRIFSGGKKRDGPHAGHYIMMMDEAAKRIRSSKY